MCQMPFQEFGPFPIYVIYVSLIYVLISIYSKRNETSSKIDDGCWKNQTGSGLKFPSAKFIGRQSI